MHAGRVRLRPILMTSVATVAGALPEALSFGPGAETTIPMAVALIGGVVVTESVYTIPGLGRLTVDAVLARDYPTIQAVILLFSLAYVLINLAVDMTYTFFDPRIRY